MGDQPQLSSPPLTGEDQPELSSTFPVNPAKETSLSEMITNEVRSAISQLLPASQTTQNNTPSLHVGTSSGITSQTTSLSSPEPVSSAPNTAGISLQEAVTSVLTQQGEFQNAPISHDVMFDLPLGATLESKIRAKIVQGEFVDLASILNPSKDDLTILVKPDSAATISLGQNKKKSLLSIELWTSAMLTYAAVYLQAHSTEAPALLKYIDFIRVMASHSPNGGWRTYDESFRRAKAATAIPWDKPLINLYVGAMFSAQRSQSFPSPKPFRGQQRPFIPKGYCYRFNLGKCEDRNCKYKHQCSKCQSFHPASACTKQSAKSQHSIEPTTHQKSK